MKESTGDPPHILFCASTRRIPAELGHLTQADLRKQARYWVDGANKMPRDALVVALSKAMEDSAVAARVLHSLAPQELAVAAVYRRYGGSVDGEVIRLDLMARGLLQVTENRVSDYYTKREWKHNPISSLANRWILLSERRGIGYYSTVRDGPDKSFERYSLHAGTVQHVGPAGPPSWSVTPAQGIPQTIIRRSSSEVAVDLSRVFNYLAGRGSVKVRQNGSLVTPTVRAMEKAVPLDGGPDFRLPDPHGLYCELLWSTGVIRVQGDKAIPDSGAATRQFNQPVFQQVSSWVHGWLSARRWFDGSGTAGSQDSAEAIKTGRQVLAWVLGCLARAGDHWYELEAFLVELHALQGHSSFRLPYLTLVWDPKPTVAQDKEKRTGEDRMRAWWFSKEGIWYANALMVTLVTLGVVERARLGLGASAPHGFRLTSLGRAVFGAPEIAPPPELVEHRCLLIQPNFDVIAYLDQADAQTAGILGRLAESDSAQSGPIRTFRLTQTSVYQAQENGLSHTQIVDFLNRHSQREVPTNVLRSLADWAGKRESISLHSGITLLGFPSMADRDVYLNSHPGAACGERFVLGATSEKEAPKPSRFLASDHLLSCRRTLKLDEHGRIGAIQPLDVVQFARLRRIAQPTTTGWQLTGKSIHEATTAGLKPALIQRWLNNHLVHPPSPLIALAIDAWAGKSRSLELADAILLHVPDEKQFEAITTSQRFRPFLLDCPGSYWLVVDRKSRKELVTLIEELGFSLSRQLTHQGLPEIGGTANANPRKSADR
jgi:Helicase conserved C-terminal domain